MHIKFYFLSLRENENEGKWKKKGVWNLWSVIVTDFLFLGVKMRIRLEFYEQKSSNINLSAFLNHKQFVHNVFQNFSGSLLVIFIFVLFQEIPEIVAFMKSDKFFKGPINNKMALIGST